MFNIYFKHYVSYRDEEEALEPESFLTKEGIKVFKKMRKFYQDISVIVQDLVTINTITAQNKRTKNLTRTQEITCMMIQIIIYLYLMMRSSISQKRFTIVINLLKYQPLQKMPKKATR